MQFESSCAGCFQGLSCQTRIEIINLLQKKGKMAVSDIAKKFKVTQPTITHHLIYLKKMGILSSKKDGRNVYYSIHPKCGDKVCNIF